MDIDCLLKKIQKNSAAFNIGILALIILSAAAIRLLNLYMEPQISRDGIHYIGILNDISAAGGYRKLLLNSYGMWYPMGFFIVPLWLTRMGISPAGAIIGFNLVLGSLCPVLVYEIARVIPLSRTVAIGSAWVTVLHPKMIKYSIMEQREMPYLFWAGIAIYCFFKGLNENRYPAPFWFGVGFFTVLAAFYRFEALEFFLILGCVFLYLLFSRTWKISKLFLAGVSVFLGASACFLMFQLFIDIPAEYWATIIQRFKTTYLGRL